MQQRNVSLPLQTRRAAPGSYDAKTRSFEAVAISGQDVRRWFGIERMRASDVTWELPAPVLNAHNNGDVREIFGKAVSVRTEGDKAIVRIELDPQHSDIAEKVERGTIPAVSVGYVVDELREAEMENGQRVFIVKKATVREVSLVAVPLDKGARIRSDNSTTHPCVIHSNEDFPMENGTSETRSAVEIERERVDEARSLCEKHKLGRPFEDALIRGATTIEAVRKGVLEALAKRSEETTIRSGFDIYTVTDETVERRAAAVDALLLRENPEYFRGDAKRADIEERAKPWRGLTLREMMRKCLEVRGVRTDGMSVNMMWERTFLTGGDLASIVVDTATKSARDQYEANQGSHVGTWASEGVAPDFKDISRIQLSDYPSLELVQPSAEIKYGVVSDGREVYRLATYAKLVSVNRQTIINDDTAAFTRIPALAARAAADLETDTVYAILTANSTMQTTGFNLFGTGHSNLSTGTGSAVISVAAIGIGRAAIRRQTNLQGRPINLRPAFLIAPASQEALAEQFTSSAYLATQGTNINPFAPGGRTPLVPVIEPRLDANSTAAWYLSASPRQIDTVEYCYLEGQRGVFFETRIGFEVDGVTWKCRDDFAAKALDFRGLWKAAGS